MYVYVVRNVMKVGPRCRPPRDQDVLIRGKASIRFLQPYPHHRVANLDLPVQYRLPHSLGPTRTSCRDSRREGGTEGENLAGCGYFHALFHDCCLQGRQLDGAGALASEKNLEC